MEKIKIKKINMGILLAALALYKEIMALKPRFIRRGLWLLC
jgi:hypothetical protein